MWYNFEKKAQRFQEIGIAQLMEQSGLDQEVASLNPTDVVNFFSLFFFERGQHPLKIPAIRLFGKIQSFGHSVVLLIRGL